MKSPSPSILKLTAGELQQLMIEAKRRAAHRGYASSSGTWKPGMTGPIVIANIGTIDGSAAPVFIGLCGEYAVSLLVNRHCDLKSKIDLSLLPGGDSGADLEFNGLRTQVKTRRTDYREFLVRHSTSSGRKDIHTANVFVFATWGGQSVVVDGCIGTREVCECPIEDARNGRGHKNYVIQPSSLLPMARLYSAIRSRKWH